MTLDRYYTGDGRLRAFTPGRHRLTSRMKPAHLSGDTDPVTHTGLNRQGDSSDEIDRSPANAVSFAVDRK